MRYRRDIIYLGMSYVVAERLREMVDDGKYTYTEVCSKAFGVGFCLGIIGNVFSKK